MDAFGLDNSAKPAEGNLHQPGGLASAHSIGQSRLAQFLWQASIASQRGGRAPRPAADFTQQRGATLWDPDGPPPPASPLWN